MRQGRQNFSALVDEAVATHQRVLVTRNGVAAVWMIPDEDFESIMETLDACLTSPLGGPWWPRSLGTS